MPWTTELTNIARPIEGVRVSHIVLLNNIDHADLRIMGGYGARFGDAVNQTRVFPAEFEALAREYPILFRQDGAGAYYAVVLLGLDRDENLFLQEGGWSARYVPAGHRRGPFSIGLQSRHADAPNDPKINVDLDHARIQDAGDPVFLRHGGAAPRLVEASAALSVVYDGLEREAAMFAAFDRAGVIEPVAIDVTVGEGQRYDIEGLHAVSRTRLADIGDEALAALNRSGWLAQAFQAAFSLGNLDQLIALKTAKASRG